jgi:hypothetical protein
MGKNNLGFRSYSRHRRKFITAMIDIEIQRLTPRMIFPVTKEITENWLFKVPL